MSDCPFTMEDLKLRCRSCDRGECWEWRGSFLHDGNRPVISKRIDTDEGRKNKQFYARHIAVWLARGKRPELGLFRAIVATCENERCINPEHLRVVTRSSVARKTAATGVFSTPLHRQKVSDGCRRRVKLSDEAVAEIRNSDDPPKVAAAKHGVSRAYVYMLRRGEFRKDYSSPFAGLGAR